MRMRPSESCSHARINCRVEASIKKRVEEVAGILGQPVAAFTETALSEKADDVVSGLGAIRLSERDFRRFVKAINNPPRPTAKLRKAAAAYQTRRARESGSNW